MLIFLIGMMGVGKTTLGKQLAQRLGYTFIDLDNYIEQRAGRTIPQLFEQEGQLKFRELERQALEAVVQEHKQAVIATGGGAPCFFDNMAFINQHGTSIFLDLPTDELLQRLQATDLSQRPLLAGKTLEDLHTYVINILQERRMFYKQASYTLSEKNLTLDTLLTLLNIK